MSRRSGACPQRTRGPERVAFGDQAAAFDVAYRPGRLVFERRSPDSNVMRLDVEMRTATPLQFLNSTREDLWPAYSPDGKHIALVSSRTGQVEIWVCESTGGDPVQLTRNRRRTRRRAAMVPRRQQPRPRVSHGLAVVAGDCVGRPRSGEAARNGRGVERRERADMVAERPLDSTSRRTGTARMRSGRFHPRAVRPCRSPGTAASPHRKRLTANSSTTRSDGITPARRLSTRSGACRSRAVTRPWSCRGSRATGPSPWAGAACTTPAAQSGQDSIRVHDLATGRSRLLLELSRPIAAGLSLSPDERYLLYSQTDDEGSELMLADNFR